MNNSDDLSSTVSQLDPMGTTHPILGGTGSILLDASVAHVNNKGTISTVPKSATSDVIDVGMTMEQGMLDAAVGGLNKSRDHVTRR